MYKVIITISIIVLINCKIRDKSKNICNEAKYHIEDSKVIIDEVYIEPYQLAFMDTLFMFFNESYFFKFNKEYSLIIKNKLNNNNISIFQFYSYLNSKGKKSYNVGSMIVDSSDINIIEINYNNLENFEVSIDSNTEYNNILYKEKGYILNKYKLNFKWSNFEKNFISVTMNDLTELYFPDIIRR